MRCIFVDGMKCMAQLNTGVSWRPEGEDMQRGRPTYNFQDCQRARSLSSNFEQGQGGHEL